MITVLLVEDDHLLRLTLREYLHGAGLAVREAHSVATAGEALHSECPDVILCDYILPDGTAPDVARQGLSLCGRIPLILMSGWPQACSDARFYDEYVAKPPDLSLLVRTIRRLCRPAC